jgi:histidine ammonia-lyase
MVTIGKKALTADDFQKVIFENARVKLSPDALKKVQASFDFIEHYAEGKLIYGINTGFGPMAQYKINEHEKLELQYNLIRSHCSGSGEVFTDELARATMLARLVCLMQGASGVHIQTVELLAQLLNEGISPCIFQRGGVGSSGDLVQLAHLALNLIGEGEVIYNGTLQPAARVFEEKRSAANHSCTRGIALMNGTSAMTG